MFKDLRLINHLLGAVIVLTLSTSALAADKPNILFIMGDDIGVSNISAYSHGMMGYQTPNIDSLAKDGAMFTDFYAQARGGAVGSVTTDC
jgi:hypothetical protein